MGRPGEDGDIDCRGTHRYGNSRQHQGGPEPRGGLRSGAGGQQRAFDRGLEFLRGLIAPRREFFKGREDDAAQLRPGGGLNFRWRHGQGALLRGHYLEAAFALEGRVSRDYFVEDDAGGVDVAAGIGGEIAEYLLRRHVTGRAGELPGLRLAWAGKRAGEAEIGEFDRAAGPNHHVFGLDVAVDDSVGMRIAQSGQHGEHVAGAFAKRQAAAAEDGAERLTLDELHHQHQAHRRPESIVHGGDVRVIEAGLYLNLAQEALLFLGIAGPVAALDLEGVDPLCDDVLGLKHLAVRSGSDRREDPVVADQRARLQGHRATR